MSEGRSTFGGRLGGGSFAAFGCPLTRARMHAEDVSENLTNIADIKSRIADIKAKIADIKADIADIKTNLVMNPRFISRSSSFSKSG